VRFADAIDLFVRDMRAHGRMNSDATEVSYRACLNRHADVIGNRDPRYVGREDVKRTLAHWTHPNTQLTNRSALISFYDWCMEEGIRKDNPARQTRRPRRRPVSIYRLTEDESVRMLQAARGARERRAIFLGICAGLRNGELRGLQGRHFERKGLVWVSSDIAKGRRERWLPVTIELEPVVVEICRNVARDEYVLPAQRVRDVGINRERFDRRKEPSSSQALRSLVRSVGRRAGISAPIHPHLLRHAYGDNMARYAGIRNAQFLMGHANVSTTETYLGRPTLDELRRAVAGFKYGLSERTAVLGVLKTSTTPLEATTGIEPV
jgi:site-specific recombinase XerD